MSHFRGLFAGLTTIDIQYYVDFYPTANKKIKTTPPEFLVGGPATNAAVAFSYLNKSASLATAVGNNNFSDIVQSDFKSTGIQHFDLTKKQKNKAVIASVVTSLKNGDRNIFTHHPGRINPSITPELLFKKANPQILLLDGFYPEFSIECAKLAQKTNIPVILDAGSWKPQYEELIPLADTVICSSDFYPPNVVDNESLFDYFEARKVKNAAISRGYKSILFNTEKGRGEVPVKHTQVVDTLGAGDFLHGAFCFYFLSSDFNFQTALEKASCLATFTCRFKGTRNWLNFSQGEIL
jgi:sugar/nucleoside kinase (ribokinase family)